MSRLCQILLILIGAIGAFLMLGDPSAGASQTQTQSQRRGLSPEEKRGKGFYLRGESSSGQEITAMMGEIEVPAMTLTCASCHGARGEGKTEGGVTAGNVTWSELTKPYGHAHETGRKHSAFSKTSFVRTVTAGVDPAGNKLSVAMPTYQEKLWLNCARIKHQMIMSLAVPKPNHVCGKRNEVFARPANWLILKD